MQAVLALNAGSSSLKFALYRVAENGADLERMLRGVVSGIDTSSPTLQLSGASHTEKQWATSNRSAIAHDLLEWIERRLDNVDLIAVGHRVVHGGRQFDSPIRIDPEVIAQIDALTPLAPLHQPAILTPIRELYAVRPHLVQVACFDTCFHHGLHPPASRYAIPRHLEAMGIRRYGFHGLSYEAIAQKLSAEGPDAATQRIIVAHLGSGSSLCAMRGLRSIDTSMGFTALDGVMMGTRPGSLDPGILLYLQRAHGYDTDRLEQMLYHESGLLGISGTASDVATLLDDPTPEAREALDLFTYSVAKQIAALGVPIGGLDCLVFTGGIGEHAWQVRAAIVEHLGWLGAEVDAGANRAGDALISGPQSAIQVRVMATDEEGVIAKHTLAIARD